jgi:hypothetical protein
MMKATAFCLAVLVGCFASSAARADLIPPWSYATASSPSAIFANGSAGPVVINEGHAGVGRGDILAATFQVFSNAGTTEKITPTPFTETIFLRSGDRIAEATFDFLLTGMISPNGTYLAVVPQGPTIQRVHLNHTFFDITPDPYHMPAHYQGEVGGWLTFTVNVHHNPEPSSLLLAGIGLPMLAGFLRRRARPAA